MWTIFGEMLPTLWTINVYFPTVFTRRTRRVVSINGWLREAWLPEESIFVDVVPDHIKHSRHHAFRYVDIEELTHCCLVCNPHLSLLS